MVVKAYFALVRKSKWHRFRRAVKPSCQVSFLPRGCVCRKCEIDCEKLERESFAYTQFALRCFQLVVGAVTWS